jgi:hypothetical protein
VSKVWQHSASKSEPQTHPICSHDTISVHAKLFQIIHIDPMNDTGVAEQHLIAHHCQAMRHFQLRGVKSFAPRLQNRAKDPMNDTGVAQQHLIAHHCQAMTHFQPRGVKSFAPRLQNRAKPTPFAAMTPYLFMPSYFRSIMWIQ